MAARLNIVVIALFLARPYAAETLGEPRVTRDLNSGDAASIIMNPEASAFANTFNELLQNQVQVTCDPNTMCITISKSFYELRGISKVDFRSLELSSPCEEGVITGDDQDKTMCTGLMACGTNMALNTTHVIFRNKVRSYDVANDRYPSVVIGQWSEHVLPWECVYPLDYLVSITSSTTEDDFYFSPTMSQIRTITLDISASGIGYGEFPVGMFLFESSSYDSVHSSPPEYAMDARIYVGVSLLEGPEVAVIEVQRCWATPTNSTDDDFNLPLINNFCPIDIVNVETKNETRHFRFNSEVFKFPSSPEVYLHCFVTICFADRQFCNQISKCDASNNRMRRSVTSDKHFREAVLSVGPVYVTNDVTKVEEVEINLDRSTSGSDNSVYRWVGDGNSVIYIIAVFGVASLISVVAVVVLVSRRCRQRR